MGDVVWLCDRDRKIRLIKLTLQTFYRIPRGPKDTIRPDNDCEVVLKGILNRTRNFERLRRRDDEDPDLIVCSGYMGVPLFEPPSEFLCDESPHIRVLSRNLAQLRFGQLAHDCFLGCRDRGGTSLRRLNGSHLAHMIVRKSTCDLAAIYHNVKRASDDQVRIRVFRALLNDRCPFVDLKENTHIRNPFSEV